MNACLVGSSLPPDACERRCQGRSSTPSVSYSEPTFVTPMVREKTVLETFAAPAGLLFALVSAVALHRRSRRRDEAFWSSVEDRLDQEARDQAIMQARHASIAEAIAELRGKDAHFSLICFQEFAHALYVEAHRARVSQGLDRVRPFLTAEARRALAACGGNAVEAIIVGGMEVVEVTVDPAVRRVTARLQFEANYTEQTASGPQSYFAREIWTLTRSVDAQSREPARARVIGCGHCGAPLEKLVGETCAHCGTPAKPGQADWLVTNIEIAARDVRPPQLTGDTEEIGTDNATLVARAIKSDFATLRSRDPAFVWSDFEARVRLVFHAFHEAWSAQDLAAVRPYLSDTLFETQRYWICAYQAQGLRNVTEEPRIASIALSRIVRDPHFEAITVRVFAQCVDYTLRDERELVAGSRQRVRHYSEYWTLIRSVERRGAVGTEPLCPNCGAPATNINMAGSCASCGVKVTTGEFDWVLSRIEQDESYRL